MQHILFAIPVGKELIELLGIIHYHQHQMGIQLQGVH